MHGSWSIKAVLPTVAPDLSYAKLGDVRDGLAAQTAYLEAIDAEDVRGPPRRIAHARCSTTAGTTRSRSCGSWSSSAARG